MTTVVINTNDTDAANVGAVLVSGSNTNAEAADIYYTLNIDSQNVVPETQVLTNVAVNAVFSFAFYIPEDSVTGEFLSGSWQLIVSYKRVSGSVVLSQETFSFTYSPDSRQDTITISDEINCSSGKMTFTDATEYDVTNGTYTKNWSIYIPPIGGYPANTVTSTNDSVTLNIDWLNVTYRVSLVVNAVYTLTTNVTERQRLSKEYDYKVQCLSLSGICDCAYEKLKEYTDSINCSRYSLDDYVKLTSILLRYIAAKDCGNGNNANTAINELKELLNCTCCDDSNTAVRFTLPGDVETTPETNWKDITTLDNSFLNASPTLKWKINRDGSLWLYGKIQVPGGLTVGTPVTLASNWANSSNDYSGRGDGMIIYALSGDGQALGAIYIDSSTGSFLFVPRPDYTGGPELAYINGMFK